MEDIHTNQNQIYTAIQQLGTNIKKDSASRKTVDYFKRRLETLDQYWSKYQYNHDRLLMEESKSHPYFIDRNYERTEELYITTKALINRQHQVLLTTMQESQQGGSTQEEQGPAKPEQQDPVKCQSPPAEVCSRGSSSKLDELLKKQASNFRALQRTVAGIDLNSMTEKWELKDALRTLQSRWSIIDSLHWELDSELEGANQEYEVSYTRQEKLYNQLKNEINRKLGSVVHKENWTPKIDIPFFNGNYQHWVSFKDLFVEAIHSNVSLSNAHKMQFLKSKVRGEAERLIQHLQVSSDNYNVCWEILNNRYNNTWLIFTSHLDLVLNLPVVQQANVHQIKKMHDTTLECLNSIRNLDVNVDSWDPFIVRILLLKLDADTHDHYLETRVKPRDLPKLTDFLNFLESRFTALESSRKKNENSKPATSKQSKSSSSSFKKSFASKTSINNFEITCPLCKESHGIYYCSKFLNMTPSAKRHAITRLHLCKNCLYSHEDKECASERRCRECRGKHNTLLHEAFYNKASCYPITENKTSAVLATRTQNQESQENHIMQQGNNVIETLLATAMIKVQASDGSYHKLRALIDQGSQTSLISARAVQQLGLSRKYCKAVICGIGERESSSKGVTNITCCSYFHDFTFKTDVVIMDTLINQLPRCTFTKPTWAHLAGIQLADPEYNVSRPIDILLGADVYSHIILEGIIRADLSLPVAQQTRLGWVLCGNLKTFHCNVVLNQVDEVQRFWEIEDITESPNLSAEDLQCIEYYKKTTTRHENGTYEVRLPFQENFETQLGLSKNKAMAQFQQLERKFHNNEEVAKQYKLFMQEYKTLGHMIPASGNMQPGYYLPHHCVLRSDSTTTALRVVFNASSKTTTGCSLNDVMLKGPNLQQDLQALLLSWRQYRVAFTADIEKMYRFIWLNKEDQRFQKIIWRDSLDVRHQVYQLCTVTYGTKAAPFLAMMTLKQLAEDEKQNFDSVAIKTLERSFYMDDVLHGSHSVESAVKLKQDLIQLLKSGGFNLRKWSSNASALQDDTIGAKSKQENFEFKEVETSKTLGLRWNSRADLFTFQSKIEPSTKIPTKRSMLSDISKLFDPLGWLSPISTKLKLLFQQVWMSNIQWDDKLPNQTSKEWLNIKSDMHKINKFKLERWLGTGENSTLELHGFCDASNKAYACVVYCKTEINGKTKISLVAGKARLAPVNKSISLPRLELSGALLMAKLLFEIQQCFISHNIKIYSWTDSMVILAWLQGDPGRWKPFVANRVRQISSIIPKNSWRHVKSAENPADCASRGMGVDQLKNHMLWWQGPSWLSSYDPDQETGQAVFTTDEEARKAKNVNHISQQESDDNILDHVREFSCGTLYYRTFFVDSKRDALYVGAMDRLYRLNMNNISASHCERDSINLEPSNVAQCVSKGKSEHFDCRNHVRVIQPMGDGGRLYVCGTNAHSPKDWVLYSNLTHLPRHEYVPGIGMGVAKCPYDPADNSTALWVERGNPGSLPALYSGTNAEFTKADTVIFRTDLHNLTTGRREYAFKRTLKYDSKWLDKPNFVGSFDVGENVLFFFRETAVEYINCGKAVYSRVARVCKRDTGGKNILSQNWATYLKARLNCSIPGEFPFYFNEIQSIYKVPGDDSRFYGVFTTASTGLMGSAICTFTISDIQKAFEGKFKEQASSSSAWLPVISSKVPEPRPGTCVNDTSSLPDTVLNFIRSHPLMDSAVSHENEKPIYYKRDLFFTRLVVDKVKVEMMGHQLEYTVYYAGTNEGKVHKIVQWNRNGDSQSALLDIFDVTPAEPIQAMAISRVHGSLYAASDRRVLQLRLALCARRYDACVRCARDPYCGWDRDAGVCREYTTGLIQDVANETADICDTSIARKSVSATWGQSLHLGSFVKMPEVLQPRAVSWYHYSRDKGRHPITFNKPEKYIETSEHGLLIISVNEADAGRYDCWLGGSLLCSYNITVDTHRCSPPEKSNEYQKIYSNWCHEFEKYKTAMKTWERKQEQCARQNDSNQNTHPNEIV